MCSLAYLHLLKAKDKENQEIMLCTFNRKQRLFLIVFMNEILEYILVLNLFVLITNFCLYF